MSDYKEQINKMYDLQLASQKAQLQTDYETADANLTAQQQQAQKVTDANLNRTAVEAQRAAVSNEEYHNANGLSSGARAQARLSLDNQRATDMAAIRVQQQETDAEVERQRGLLAKEYAAAIQKAQADNDMAKAQALYQEAKDEDAKLLAKQEAAAQLMSQTGDFSGYGSLYGLTDAQIAALKQSYDLPAKEAAAQLLAESGDYSLVGALYGLTPAQIQQLQSTYQEEKDAPNKQAAAQLLAQYGDFSGLGELYGLSANQVKMLQSAYTSDKDADKKQAAAQLMAESGDYSLVGALYGLTPAQISTLTNSYNTEKNAATQEASASTLAGMGDFTALGKLYGWTDQQIANANAYFANNKNASAQEAAAKLMAQGGDYSRLGALYGLSDAEIKKLNALSAGGTGSSTSGSSSSNSSTNSNKVVAPKVEENKTLDFSENADNEGLTNDQVETLQKELGVDADGKWGPKTRAAAYKKWGVFTPTEVIKAIQRAARIPVTGVWDTATQSAYDAGYRPTTDVNSTGNNATTHYQTVNTDLQQMEASGKSSSEIKEYLEDMKAYLTTSEYNTLYDKYCK